MPEYSFCESITAGPQSHWHIRELTHIGRRLGGGIDTPSLCGRVVVGWDREVEITPFHLEKHTCPDCLKRYQEGEAMKPTYKKEHEQWQKLCGMLKATGAVTEQDLSSRLSEDSTLGQQLLRAIRLWGDLRVELELERRNKSG